MLYTKVALCLSSLVLLASAQSEDAVFNGVKPGLSRTPTVTSNRLLMTRDLQKRCTGTCAECFGDGYTLCPSSAIYCYLPGDATYGLDTCSSSSSGSGTGTSSATGSTSTSGSSGSDSCYQVGATCTSCFGPTYKDCPDGLHCYDPNDPLYDTCPEDSAGGGTGGSTGGSSGSTTPSCESLYGSGSVSCGDDSCYNPGDGEVCCQDGYHCEDGYTCSSIVGKCCAPGSTSSSCSGSNSGGLLTSSSSTRTTSSTRTASSATSILSTGTRTAASTSTATAGSSLEQGSGNGAGAVTVQMGLILAAGVGALVL